MRRIRLLRSARNAAGGIGWGGMWRQNSGVCAAVIHRAWLVYYPMGKRRNRGRAGDGVKVAVDIALGRRLITVCEWHTCAMERKVYGALRKREVCGPFCTFSAPV